MGEDVDNLGVDRGVHNPPPRRVLGPYLIGPGGYKTVEDAVSVDPDFLGNLDDAKTWFDIERR
jgi:hypothetical protein